MEVENLSLLFVPSDEGGGMEIIMVNMKSKKKKTWDDILFDTITTVVAVILIIIFFYPLYYLVIASLSDMDAVFRGEVKYWVVGFSLDSYKALLGRADIWRGYLNSIYISSYYCHN